MLKDGGRAAIVVPDNVLFEGGAGEEIRRELLRRCDVHTLLRLPPGIWYSPGVKANVLFFDKRSPGRTSATSEVWIYDLRTGQDFSLRQKPIQLADMADFVRSYNPDDRTRRREHARFRRFKYSDIVARERANLDIQWPYEPALVAPKETPDGLMREILKDLEEAMNEFAAAEASIRR